MKKLLFITTILFSNTAFAQHPITLSHVDNFARDIEKSDDFKALKQWNEVLRKQPIIEGKGKPTYAMLKAINDKVNEKPYEITKEWQTPAEFAKATSGDCKGYSIAKYYMLRRIGFKASQLNLWAGDYDGHSHMLLVASLDDKQYVLDIGFGNDLPEAKDYFFRHFQPAYRFNELGWDVN